jgi:hypothetical protein
VLHCCIDSKGFEFCAQCDELPCSILEEWIGGIEHHAKAVGRLKEMKEMGVEKWMESHGYSTEKNKRSGSEREGENG